MKTNALLTRDEACRRLRISRATLWRLGERGALPVVRVGARVLYREQDLELFIERSLTRKGGRP